VEFRRKRKQSPPEEVEKYPDGEKAEKEQACPREKGQPGFPLCPRGRHLNEAGRAHHAVVVLDYTFAAKVTAALDAKRNRLTPCMIEATLA
jgi:hypothetical protein